MTLRDNRSHWLPGRDWIRVRPNGGLLRMGNHACSLANEPEIVLRQTWWLFSTPKWADAWLENDYLAKTMLNYEIWEVCSWAFISGNSANSWAGQSVDSLFGNYTTAKKSARPYTTNTTRQLVHDSYCILTNEVASCSGEEVLWPSYLYILVKGTPHAQFLVSVSI